MQTHKKLKARVLSLVLSALMVVTTIPMNVLAAREGGLPADEDSGIIVSFDQLEDRFSPSTGKDASDHVYSLTVELDTAEEALQLPDELTATVKRTYTTSTPSNAGEEIIPDEDEMESGNQPASPSDAEEEVKDETTEIPDEDVPLAPEPEQNEETVTTTIKSENIHVTWNSDKEYKSDENGKFIFTAVLPEGYILADGVELPQIYVFVGKQARTGSVTPRTTTLDLTAISASNLMGATLADGVYTHATEGWSYDTNESVPVLTLNGVSFNISSGHGIKVPSALTILLADDTTNSIRTATGTGGIYSESGTAGTITVKCNKSSGNQLSIEGGQMALWAHNTNSTFVIDNANVKLKADMVGVYMYGLRMNSGTLWASVPSTSTNPAVLSLGGGLSFPAGSIILGSTTSDAADSDLTAAADRSGAIKMGADGSGDYARTVKISPTAETGALAHDIGTDGSLTLNTSCTCTESSPHVVSGTTTSNTITVADGEHWVTLDGVSISASTASAFRIQNGTVHLSLAAGTTNTLTGSGIMIGALDVNSAALDIDGSGALTASGGMGRAGISVVASSITINDGTINATGGIQAPGIGNGVMAGDALGSIEINGGTVTATAGNNNSSGIGGAKGTVAINGGAVTAIGTPGIGGGDTSDPELEVKVTIGNNATVVAVSPTAGGSLWKNRGIYAPSGGTVANMMAFHFTSEMASGTAIEIKDNNDQSLSPAVTYTPTANFNSIAFSVPSTGNYKAYAGTIKMTGTAGDTFAVEEGLNTYSDITVNIPPSITVGGSSATIGYETANAGNLQKAFKDIPDGGTVKTGAAIDLGTTEVTISGTKSVTLDLNGQTITYSGSGQAIKLIDSASLTVADGTQAKLGKLEGAGKESTAVRNEGTGAVNVTGGTISTGSSTTIRNLDNGTVNVSGGTVSCVNQPTIYNFKGGMVNVSGGTVSSGISYAIYNYSKGVITISGSALVTSINKLSNSGTIYINSVTPAPTAGNPLLKIEGGTVSNTANPEGYSVYVKTTAENLATYYSKTGGTVGRVYPEALEIIVGGSSATAGYETADAVNLQKAFTDIPDGGTVKTGATIDLGTTEVTISGTKSVTLDLNGQTVSGSGDYVINFDNTGTLTVTDSSSGGTGTLSKTSANGSTIKSKGTVQVLSGTVSIASKNGSAINSFAGNAVNVSGGTVSATGSSNAILGNNTVVTVSGGTVSATVASAISNYGTTNVSNGTVSATGNDGYAILQNSGTVNVSGGNISATGTGGRAIYTYGITNISGGTVQATDSSGIAIYNYSGKKITISGSAIVTSVNTNTTFSRGTIYLSAVPNTAAVILDIQGGTVSNTASPTAGYALYFADSDVTADNLSNYYTKASSATVGKVYPEAAATAEQFTLPLGETYYFDLSGEAGTITGGVSDKLGTINTALPDATLHYVPFTYAGTVNAYSLDSSSSGDTGASAAATASDRSLFVADYNVSSKISWDSLNTNNLIFGKDFNTNYKLRSLSGGSNISSSNTQGSPSTNEWDTILDKNMDYIKNYTSFYTWAQDTTGDSASYRVVRGKGSAQYWDRVKSSVLNAEFGFRPALEVLNPSALTSDGLKAVELDWNGGKFNNSTDSIQIVCAGDNFKTPGNQGLTRPDGNTGTGFSWNTAADGTGTKYDAGASVAKTVTKLYAQWETAKTLSGIAVTTPPTKTIYNAGESFDKTGMVVTATYSDASTAAVTSYTITPSGALAASDTKVTVSYTEDDVTKTADISITVNGSSIDKSELQNAITAANNAKRIVIVSDNDASSVSNGTKFVTTAEMKALTDAIAAAKAVADDADATEAEVTAAVTALNNAVNTFKAAIKTGTKSGGSSGGGSSSSGQTIWTSVPPAYTGGTKIIGNVRVPDYTVEGNWKNTNGAWTFTGRDGQVYKNSWAPVFNPYANVPKGQSAFDWFLFDANGTMMTGWYTDAEGNTYYLNPNSDNTLGAMQTGWVLIDGKYYYFNEMPDGTRGKLFQNTRTPDGYLVDENGVWNGSEKQ